MFVAARERCSDGGRPSRWMVKHSSMPSRKLAAALLAGLGKFSAGNLLRGEFEHGLDSGAAGDADDLVNGSTALPGQFNQRRHELRVLAEQASELVGAEGLLF